MKRILTLLLLSIAISAQAQISITTRVDSVYAINNRQITTSVPPNLVYPVQVGSKTDSLCAIINSLVDTVNNIVGTTLGLQTVTDNLDTTNNSMTVGDGTFYTVHSPIGITTVKKSGNMVESYLGYISGKISLLLKDVATTNYFYVNSGTLTANHFGYFPNEGTSGGGIPSTFVLHHTIYPITVDNTGSGDSTVIAQGSIQLYAPPVTSLNMHSWLTPFSLHFGQINTAHTHIDGLTVGFTADGSNYAQNFQNDTGAIALVHNITDAIAASTTVTPTYFAYGNTDGTLTSSPDAIFNRGNEISFGISGMQLMDLSRPAGNITASLGDAANSTNGTKIVIADNSKSTTITNAFALKAIQVYTVGGSVTMNDGTPGMRYDPATLQSSATITTCANPVDGQQMTIYFGGTTLTGHGTRVITLLTLAANAGQSLAGIIVPNLATTSTILHLVWMADIATWYVW
jgi:hypothetical protein